MDDKSNGHKTDHRLADLGHHRRVGRPHREDEGLIAVKVPGGVTVAAVLIGAALLGVIGALVAIPIAAALQLLAQELLFPVLDEA